MGVSAGTEDKTQADSLSASQSTRREIMGSLGLAAFGAFCGTLGFMGGRSAGQRDHLKQLDVAIAMDIETVLKHPELLNDQMIRATGRFQRSKKQQYLIQLDRTSGRGRKRKMVGQFISDVPLMVKVGRSGVRLTAGEDEVEGVKIPARLSGERFTHASSTPFIDHKLCSESGKEVIIRELNPNRQINSQQVVVVGRVKPPLSMENTRPIIVASTITSPGNSGESLGKSS